MKNKNGFWMPTYYVGYVWWEDRWYSFDDIDAYEEYIDKYSK